MTSIDPITLTGQHVVLEPLSHAHHDGLVEAARDGELWKLWYTTVPGPEGMAAEIDRRLRLQEAGSMLPFTTRLLDPAAGGPGRVIGMTTYMNIDAATPRVEIGSTWNAASSHGTGTNADSKLLLLRHAFETLGCPAVEFRTHWLNHQSREAIARLGAKQDGVLRSHTRTADGQLRDTVVFSILEHEWPMVRAGLEFRLAKQR
ncbi:RimJ/RimL family protein N-acetyltransferase [Arthrobacter sp. PvP102]|uniref:GNAT family N-acetyltransferase n=1 Tax=unclassified Arthrobacter TaxID=235627 RepID=UPI0000527B51|nr:MULTISPECIES: GNAT family protein [unclassified Arthrobacter]ABK04640.1 GCN5-related N-acetyltransferase [Arthrobacter sp. FB24]MBP1232593.1 RimJ/RimL family protein N-acetyltransferase [Arthrobacter sp. PvP103]MBP1237728.1 RimJ/RimL family protein N-acetyltransferase [Arthrobacter sp. PvP102]